MAKKEAAPAPAVLNEAARANHKVIPGYTTDADILKANANPNRPVERLRYKTGLVVLPNNKLDIIKYFVPADSLMKPVEEVYTPEMRETRSTQAAKHIFIDGYTPSRPRYQSIQSNHHFNNKVAYASAYERWINSFFEEVFLLSQHGGPYAPWECYRDHAEMVIGQTGFGSAARWSFMAFGGAFHHPCPISLKPVHIAYDSHDKDDSYNPVGNLLPHPSAEPPAPAPAASGSSEEAQPEAEASSE